MDSYKFCFTSWVGSIIYSQRKCCINTNFKTNLLCYSES